MRKNYTIVTVIMKYLKTYAIFKLDAHMVIGKSVQNDAALAYQR